MRTALLKLTGTVALALAMLVPAAQAADYVNVDGVVGVPALGPYGSHRMLSSCTTAAPNAGRGIFFDCNSFATKWIIGSGAALDCWQGAAPSCSSTVVTNDVFMCDGTGQTVASHCTCAPNMINCSNNCQVGIANPGTCGAGQTWNACTGVCVGNITVLLQTTPVAQGSSGAANAAIAINGNLDLAGSGVSQGDIFMANGKAVQVNGGAPTSLNIGNFTTPGSFTLSNVGDLWIDDHDTAGKGVQLEAADRPLITRGWDTFSSGVYSGVGRWGMFMETSTLTLGVPNIGAAALKVRAFNADSSGVDLLSISSAGVMTVTSGSIFPARFQGSHATATAVEIRNTAANRAWELAVSNTYLGAGKFYLQDQTANATRLAVDTAGNVGIGYLPGNPAKNLDISGVVGGVIMRLADLSPTIVGAPDKLWTGMRLDRGTGVGAEKWFIGMTDLDEDLTIRTGGTTEVVNINNAGDITVNGPITFGGPVTYSSPDSSTDLNCSLPSMAAVTTLPGSGVNGDPTGPGGEQGYLAANAYCDQRLDGSHVCTAEEILRSIFCSQTASFPANGVYWVAGGPPGFVSPQVNDCAGFNDSSPSAGTTSYGAVWQFAPSGSGFGRGAASECNAQRQFACCK